MAADITEKGLETLIVRTMRAPMACRPWHPWARELAPIPMWPHSRKLR